MGLFSSKKEIVVNTSVARVIEDAMVPDAKKSTTLLSLLQDGDLMADFQDYGLSGGFRKFEKGYAYAKSGRYINGLPNVKLLTSSGSRDSVQTAIESSRGFPVTLVYSNYLPLNNVHVGWKTVIEQYGYNHVTNELEVLSGTVGYPVYLDNLVAVHEVESGNEPEAGSLQLFEGSPNPMAGYTPERVTNATLGGLVADDLWIEGPDEEEAVQIRYIWEDEDRVIHKDMIVVDLSNYSQNDEYYQAHYTYSVAGKSQLGFFTYEAGQGRYPDLDNFYSLTRETPGTYFPIIPFWQQGKAVATDPEVGGIRKQSTKGLMKRMDLDFDAITENLAKNDMDGVEQVVMMMGVPLVTEDPSELKYLHAFFQKVYLDVANEPRVNGEQYALSFSEEDFKLVISFRGITQKLKTGVLSSVGQVTQSTTSLDTLLDNSASTEVTTGRQTRGKQDYYYFYLQLTEHVVQEIRVDSVRFRYVVYGGESTGGNGGSANMLIPLDYEICKRFSFLEKERLYFRSLHFVFNTVQIIETEWYQTKAFQIVITVIAIIMAIPSGGSSFSWAAAAASLGTVAGLQALVWNLVIKRLVTQFVFKVLTKVFGPEFALALSIGALFVGLAHKQGAFSIGKGVFGDTLADLSTGLVGQSGSANAERMKDFQNANTSFQQMAAEQTELLEQTAELLSPQNLLDPREFLSLQPLTIFGEDPDDMYARTVEADNIGTTSFQIVENFVDISLRLPTINATLGNT